MSQRLERVAQNLCEVENRVADWRKKYPLSREKLRAVFYEEKYAKIVDQTFQVFIQNPDIFKHANLEDFSREEERKSAAIMVKAMHKLRPVDPKCYLQGDIHSMSVTAHAIYYFDPGFSVKCDISYFLYAKSLHFFSSSNPIQQEITAKAMSMEHIGCFGLT